MKTDYTEIKAGDVVKILDIGELITSPFHFRVGEKYLVTNITKVNITLIDGDNEKNGWTFGCMKKPPTLEIVN